MTRFYQATSRVAMCLGECAMAVDPCWDQVGAFTLIGAKRTGALAPLEGVCGPAGVTELCAQGRPVPHPCLKTMDAAVTWAASIPLCTGCPSFVDDVDTDASFGAFKKNLDHHFDGATVAEHNATVRDALPHELKQRRYAKVEQDKAKTATRTLSDPPLKKVT